VVLQLHNYVDEWISWTPPGFSRWYINFIARSMNGYRRHHQALAGGKSISELNAQTALCVHRLESVVFQIFRSQHHQIALKLKNHRLKPGGVFRTCGVAVALKLKNHRLKPGGVSRTSGVAVALKLKNHRLKPGGVIDSFSRHPSPGSDRRAPSVIHPFSRSAFLRQHLPAQRSVARHTLVLS